MNKFQLLVGLVTNFSINLLYANPIEEMDYQKKLIIKPIKLFVY